jgi:hypothetical protein
VYQRFILTVFCLNSAIAFAKAGDTLCVNQVTASPAWAESLKPNHRSRDGQGHTLEFHYESIRPRFLNIGCTQDSACAEHLLRELKRKEPAFVSPHPSLALLIRESLKLAEEWHSALALTWERDKDSTWSVRLSIDIPPPGKHMVQSEAIEIDHESRIERIDITVSSQRTAVLYANVPAIEVGNDIISAENGSHGAGVILDPDQPVPMIDSQTLRREFFNGPMASASLNRVLDTSLVLVRAQRPDADKVLLSGRRGVLAEHFNGRWIWPALQ